jgi:hypothetical protein
MTGVALRSLSLSQRHASEAVSVQENATQAVSFELLVLYV